jgi:hypothetical protein
MSPLDLFLQEIKEHPAFPELMKRINEGRPVIPEFDSMNDNTEDWKKKSGIKRGYDLCLAMFKIGSST